MHRTWPARRLAFSLLVAGLVCSCSHAPPKGVGPETPREGSGPPSPQIMRDLIGKTFLYFITGNERRPHQDRFVGIWTVGEGELEEFTVLQRFPDLKRTYGDRTDEVHALVRLRGGDQVVRGVLVFQYVKGEKGWELYAMGPRDGDRHHDFSFERRKARDGSEIAPMAPTNPPTGPWRFTPHEMTTPIPELRGPVIQAW